jgi:hypothetical protein
VLTPVCNNFGFFSIDFHVMLLHYVFASATSVLIYSHSSLVFRTSTAQKSNGEYIVGAFGLTSRASPLLGVCDPEGSYVKRKFEARSCNNCCSGKPIIIAIFSFMYFCPLPDNGRNIS